jgi:(2R)-ethylmalonyl-CoA mutase
VNSLGLTEQQPENNILRIVIEMLSVTLSKRARARAVQLPAWNEALGLPRPWDQQWSLRAQQILAFETDLLEHGDLFDGSVVVEARVRELEAEAWREVEVVLARGGAIAAVESGYIKQRLVESNAARLGAIERGEQVVVGLNAFRESEPSPLTRDLDDAILVVDPGVERERVEALAAWRAGRDEGAAQVALAELRSALVSGENVMPPSIAAARAGVTTGEWAGVLRELFGEYRAPTGVAGARATGDVAHPAERDRLRAELERLTARLGRRPKLLVGKPGLDGHSNGAEQIAIKARDVGFEVVYEGIRVTPEQLVTSALEEGVHLVGLSILSGSHLQIVPEIVDALRAAGVEAPVIVGGIIPPSDAAQLCACGVARVYTPKDFALEAIMADLVALVASRAEAAEA